MNLFRKSCRILALVNLFLVAFNFLAGYTEAGIYSICGVVIFILLDQTEGKRVVKSERKSGGHG